MATYGFVIDLRKCIGCHACTIACKEEHQIPIGVNRCWVKSVEKGTFPRTRRFFFPVLCNQCEEAPCQKICPTNALFKRRDGIVDLNGEVCIGCRACMAACPYDQLFIDPSTHTAEKCNFCANRVENNLLPSCVSVCPTECRIFGDLEDPASRVSEIVQSESISVRKPEKGTRPKVFYIAAEEAAIVPEVAARPLKLYRDGDVKLRPLGSPDESPIGLSAGEPRVDYDVPHRQAWGLAMVIYLLTKGISTGSFLLSLLLWAAGWRDSLIVAGGPFLSLVFILLTAAILVADLEQPQRFFYILVRPNWRSWMAWGAFFITGHGAAVTLWLGASWLGLDGVQRVLFAPALVVAGAATLYTGFLFAQGLARDLWQGPHSTIDLLAQAIAEGAAALLVAGALTRGSPDLLRALGWILAGAIGAHLGIVSLETLFANSPTLHHELAIRSIRRGAFSGMYWGGALAVGAILPLLLLVAGGGPALGASAAVLALGGMFAWEYVWVYAGQAVPLS